MPGHKITVGNCEIISLVDAPMQFPWNIFFPDVPQDVRESYRDIYPPCYGDRGFCTDAGAFAVRSSGKTVLVDTGIGPGPIAMLGGLQGRLVDDMASKGVKPEDVDIVVHTHLHFDHVGWNLRDGRPTFPNAMYYAPAADLAFFEPEVQANRSCSRCCPYATWAGLPPTPARPGSPQRSRLSRRPATLPAIPAC